MRKLTGAVFLSLDGVMQAPGAPTEDPTHGFTLGGWTTSYWDEMMGGVMGGLFTPPYALLLGRRTYDIFAAHWPYVTGEDAAMGEALTAADKYVVTHDADPLEWENSHRVPGIDAVAALKQGDGPDLLIQGSSTLYPPLLQAGLIDTLTLLIFPVILGKGKRLFGDGTPPAALGLTDKKISTTGVIVATYEPAGAVPTGSFGLAEPNEREIARQEKMKREE